MDGAALVVLGILLLLAVGAMVMALRAARLRRALDDIPISPAAGVFIGDVEVLGVAEAADPLRTYLSEQPCVYHAWSISEDWGRWVTETYRDEKCNTRTRRRWETGATTVASGGAQIPFFLRDESGTVLVRPDGARIEPHTTVRFSCGREHAAYYGKGPAGAVADTLHRRHFHEQSIVLRARVFVVGRARERRDAVAAEIAADPDARMFLVSVREEKQVARGYGIAFWVWSALACVFVGLGSLAVAAMVAAGREPNTIVAASGMLLGPLVLLAGWAWMVFNSIVSLRQRVRRGWANVDVELKRRADLIPNLVAVVQAARMHDKDTQQVVAILRAQAAIPSERARAADARVQGVGRVMTAIAEAYPSIAAQPNFLSLQQELARTEARIAMARVYYNGVATAFNTRLAVLPDRLLGRIARLEPFELFHATDLEREVPPADFAEAAQ